MIHHFWIRHQEGRLDGQGATSGRIITPLGKILNLKLQGMDLVFPKSAWRYIPPGMKRLNVIDNLGHEHHIEIRNER